MIIDEIQNVNVGVSDTTFMRMLIQMINSSGISICLVGTPECEDFFYNQPQFARRMIGLHYDDLSFSNEFIELCHNLWRYQYVKTTIDLTDDLLHWLYMQLPRRINHSMTLTIFLSIAVLAMLYAFYSQHRQKAETLQVYKQPDRVEEKKPEETKKEFDTQIYVDAANHLSIGIPKDWRQVTKNGYQTFIHAPSGASIQIATSPYTPTLPQSAKDLSTALAEKGMTFMDFKKTGNASYQLMYQDRKNNVYDYIEHTINTFAWKRGNEIPQGVTNFYSPTAGIELFVPEGWAVSEAETAIVATSPSGNAQETLTAIKNDQNFDSISAADITELLSRGKQGFILSQYERHGNTATIIASYAQSNVQFQYVVRGYFIENTLYFLAFDYEKGAVEENLRDMCLGLLRDVEKITVHRAVEKRPPYVLSPSVI